jgi:hypothetical protein
MQLRMKSVAVAMVLLSACSVARAPKPTRATTLSLSQRVEHVELLGREPMLVEHPNGSLFIAGYGSPQPTLWKSIDHGATWSRVNVGTEAEGAVGNSDVDLAVAPDGTLYFASMLFNRTAGEGIQIAIGVSGDAGASWRWSTVSKTRFDDRPWIEVAPDGTAHAIWNDGSGVSHVVSRDRGATWTQPVRVHDQGGSSHLAIGPAGELAVRITPASASGNKFDAGVELVAVSTDGGASWQKHAAPGERDWSPDFMSDATPRWVEPIGWDRAGRLYSFWADKRGVQLARSADRGATWTTWRVLDLPQASFFPYFTVRGNGDVAATWFTASNNDMLDLQWHVARIDASGDTQPQIILAGPQTLEALRPREGQGDRQFNDPAGEYIPVAFLRDDTIAVVTTIQNWPAKRLGFTYWTFETR